MKFLSYLRDRWKILLLLVLSLGAFTGVLLLYRVETEALGYGLMVAGIAILIGFCIDFTRYRHRFDNLTQAKAKVPYELDLPAPSSHQEREYQQLMRTLFEQYRGPG